MSDHLIFAVQNTGVSGNIGANNGFRAALAFLAIESFPIFIFFSNRKHMARITKKSQVGAGFFNAHHKQVAGIVKRMHARAVKAQYTALHRHVKAAGIRMHRAKASGASDAALNKIHKEEKAKAHSTADKIHATVMKKTDDLLNTAKSKAIKKVKSRICGGASEKGSGWGWLSNLWNAGKKIVGKLIGGVKKKVKTHAHVAMAQAKKIVKAAPAKAVAHLKQNREQYINAAQNAAVDVYHNGKAGIANQFAKAKNHMTNKAKQAVGCGFTGSGVDASGVRASGWKRTAARLSKNNPVSKIGADVTRGSGVRASGVYGRGTNLRII